MLITIGGNGIMPISTVGHSIHQEHVALGIGVVGVVFQDNFLSGIVSINKQSQGSVLSHMPSASYFTQ